MSNINKYSYSRFFFAFVCVMLFFSTTSCSKKVEPKEILAGQYYDYEISSDYIFQLDNVKLKVHDVHSLTAEEYYSFAECPVLFPMYLQFNKEAMTASITSVSEEKDLKYYLFRNEDNRLLLIPEKKRTGLFEQRRPLAFYLQELADSSLPAVIN